MQEQLSSSPILDDEHKDFIVGQADDYLFEKFTFWLFYFLGWEKEESTIMMAKDNPENYLNHDNHDNDKVDID